MPKEEKNTIDAGATTVAEDLASKPEAMTDTQVEERAAARLQSVYDEKGVPEDGVETETEAKSETTEDSTPDPDKDKEASAAEKDDSTPGSESKAEEKSMETDTVAKDAEADKGAKEVTPLPDIYYRAAIHRGMTDTEVKEFYEATPELCVRTLGKVYEAVNRSSAEFASLGRARKDQMEQAALDAAAPQKEEVEYIGVDLEALEKTEIDPDALAIIKTQDEQMKALFDKLESIESTATRPQESIDRVATQESALIGQQIENFFKSDEAKPYGAGFYGVVPDKDTDWANLTPGEKANRWAVIEMMDDILVGAEMNNRDISVDEAMRMAHLNVSEPQRTKVIREELTAKLTKRSKSLSLKPAAAGKTDSSAASGKKSGEELVEVTAARMAKMSW